MMTSQIEWGHYWARVGRNGSQWRFQRGKCAWDLGSWVTQWRGGWTYSECPLIEWRSGNEKGRKTEGTEVSQKMALTDRQIRDLDKYRGRWGNEQPAGGIAVNTRRGLDKLRCLVERLVAVQRCFHKSGALGGPFSVMDIGSLVNALLRSKLPVPREAVIPPLKSQAVRDPTKAKGEHDSPISF